jgi:hypothetical protein
VTVDVPECAVQSLLERVLDRQSLAWDLMVARWSCYLPDPHILKWTDGPKDVEAPRPAVRTLVPDPLDLFHCELDQRDYDILGVTIEAAPDGRGLVVESIFGHEAGMRRVAAWIRRWVDFLGGKPA